MLKKADIILISCLVILAILSAFLPTLNNQRGSQVVVLVENREIHRVSLSENGQIDLGTNLIKIENGQVFVESATCPDKVCVHHAPVKSRGQSIICVPNGVVVEVE